MVIYYRSIVLLFAFMFSMNVPADVNSDFSAAVAAQPIDVKVLSAATAAAVAAAPDAASVQAIIATAISASPDVAAAVAITSAAVTAAPARAAAITTAALSVAPSAMAAAITSAAIAAAPASAAAITTAAVTVAPASIAAIINAAVVTALTAPTNAGISGASESQTNTTAMTTKVIIAVYEAAVSGCGTNQACITEATEQIKQTIVTALPNSTPDTIADIVKTAIPVSPNS